MKAIESALMQTIEAASMKTIEAASTNTIEAASYISLRKGSLEAVFRQSQSESSRSGYNHELLSHKEIEGCKV